MPAWLHRILILCRKESLAISKDPRGRIVLLGPVIVQTLLFGYAATFDLDEVPYAVLNENRAAVADDLLARFEGAPVFRKVLSLDSIAQIEDVIDRKQALLVLHIDAEFEKRLAAGEPAPVQLIVDGRNLNTASTAASYVRAIVDAFNDERRAARGEARSPLSVEVRAWYNQNLETRWQMVPSLVATLSMMQTLMLSALSVAREREQGTFDQLLVTPLRPYEIMVGKAVPPITVGLVQSTMVFVLALFWFRIPFMGSVPTLYIAVLTFMIAIVGVGLTVSAFSANMQQAMLYSLVLMMPIMMLSGLVAPIENMPEWLQPVTYLNPLRYGIRFVQRIYLEGAGLSHIAHELWPLVLIACVTLPVAAWLFRHRLV